MLGYVSNITDDGVHIFVPLENARAICERKQITEAEVLLPDGRTITPSQRRKIFALIHDICEYVTSPPHRALTREEEGTLREMKLLYLIQRSSEEVRHCLTLCYCELRDIDVFSLSNVNETLASDFIDWLVEMCVKHGIPCIDTLINRAEDVGRYVYVCLLHRRCAVCGQYAEVHEAERAGMGRNRAKMHHLGQLCEPLCRIHHDECHRIGQKSFDDRYLLCGVRLDEALCEAVNYKE
ncbi:MAG: hypothetical protein LBQ15_11010 [Clostridium sp.]|jgi:hypothetical protein|nr:hypothetical protein [Clostridium sp.]